MTTTQTTRFDRRRLTELSPEDRTRLGAQVAAEIGAVELSAPQEVSRLDAALSLLKRVITGQFGIERRIRAALEGDRTRTMDPETLMAQLRERLAPLRGGPGADNK